MGLIRAAVGAAGGVLADQWKEFFYCEAMPKEVLVTKGKKRVTGRSSNVKATDNIISNGSGIAVADGQCMIIVEQGRIVDVCAVPGEYTYDASSEPSIFSGNLKESIIETFRAIGKRFTYGGDPGKDQRVYYINTKEIVDNKFGTPNPIPFRVVDRKINLDVDTSVRCSGIYSYKIVDPLLFYTNVCGNVESEFTREEIDSQLKSEFISALQPAFAKISDLEIRPYALPAHAEELAQAMNEALTKKWLNLRGISVVSVALNSITLPDKDSEMIKEAQSIAMLQNPTMAAATLAGAQADAMKAAASNTAGAMTGFMGLGMAQQAGGMNAQSLFAMGQQQPQQTSSNASSIGSAKLWTCACGTQNSGNFCTNCAKPRPTSPYQWTCECGTVNTGKFCYNCGKPSPSGTVRYRCNKCGWEPKNPAQPPKFCPECGDPFNDSDKV